MLLVENPNTDPYCNHALEEWLMDTQNDDCFMLWRNEPAILLGRNQNVHAEINLPYAREHGIQIVRRITGGGTVFTDTGNLMFTFISCDGRRLFADFEAFAAPILGALRALGVPAVFSGRNDLTIDGKKCSGNAQCLYHGKLLHHGTLLYHADTGALAKALRVRELKLRGKGVSSVESRVTNISEHMARPMDLEDFRAYLFDYVMKHTEAARPLRLSEQDWDAVRTRAAEKHATPAWIFGRSPACNVVREAKLPGGIVQAYLQVEGGKILSACLLGDFFGDPEPIERALTGVRYEAEAIRAALDASPEPMRLGAITPDELMTVLI